MGGIDLDPFSNPISNGWIKAKKFYSKEDSGFLHEWNAKSLWINPPYIGNFITQTIVKLESELAKFNFQAILLLNAHSHAKWFDKLCSISDAMGYLKGRVEFVIPKEDGTFTQAPNKSGQVVFYIGNNIDLFKKYYQPYFNRAGVINLRSVDTPPVAVLERVASHHSQHPDSEDEMPIEDAELEHKYEEVQNQADAIRVHAEYGEQGIDIQHSVGRHEVMSRINSDLEDTPRLRLPDVEE